MAILSDIMIAVTLCLLLASNRSEFQDTNSIINHLIIYAINRCILTSCVSLPFDPLYVLNVVTRAVAVIEVVIVSGRQQSSAVLADPSDLVCYQAKLLLLIRI